MSAGREDTNAFFATLEAEFKASVEECASYEARIEESAMLHAAARMSSVTETSNGHGWKTEYQADRHDDVESYRMECIRCGRVVMWTVSGHALATLTAGQVREELMEAMSEQPPCSRAAPLLCHKCKQAPLLEGNHPGSMYCRRCSTGLYVTVDCSTNHRRDHEDVGTVFGVTAEQLREVGLDPRYELQSITTEDNGTYTITVRDPGDVPVVTMVPAPEGAEVPTPGITYPTFNHTRGDSALYPCAICKGLMADEQPTPRPVVKAAPWRCPGCGATEGAVHPDTCPKVAHRYLNDVPAQMVIEGPVLTIPPSRPCYVCDADTSVTVEGMPLCVGCR